MNLQRIKLYVGNAESLEKVIEAYHLYRALRRPTMLNQALFWRQPKFLNIANNRFKTTFEYFSLLI